MPVRVAIIGAGGMGSWFARFFKSRRYSVTVTDRDTGKARVLALKLRVKHVSGNVEAVRRSKIVVLATPSNATARIIKEILPALEKNALVCEISATKSVVMPALRSARKMGIKVVSIHPMFGPLADGVRGRRILHVRAGNDRVSSKIVKQLFPGARITSVEPQAHDKQVSLTLALPHLLSMAFAMTLLRKGSGNKETRRFTGRTFDLQMLLAEVIANEPETTADIQISNREFTAILKELQSEIRSLARIVKRQDRAELVARYRQVRRSLSLDPEFGSARQIFEIVTEAYSRASS